jgi:cysteine desulfurase
LNEKGIAASSGSTCISMAGMESHVLKATGVDPVLSRSSVLFSLGKDNTRDEVNYVLEILPDGIKRLHEISPLCESGA